MYTCSYMYMYIQCTYLYFRESLYIFRSWPGSCSRDLRGTRARESADHSGHLRVSVYLQGICYLRHVVHCACIHVHVCTMYVYMNMYLYVNMYVRVCEHVHEHVCTVYVYMNMHMNMQ